MNAVEPPPSKPSLEVRPATPEEIAKLDPGDPYYFRHSRLFAGGLISIPPGLKCVFYCDQERRHFAYCSNIFLIDFDKAAQDQIRAIIFPPPAERRSSPAFASPCRCAAPPLYEISFKDGVLTLDLSNTVGAINAAVDRIQWDSPIQRAIWERVIADGIAAGSPGDAEEAERLAEEAGRLAADFPGLKAKADALRASLQAALEFADNLAAEIDAALAADAAPDGSREPLDTLP